MSDLVDGGKRLGVVIRPVRADDRGLRSLPKPAVAYVEQDHFVAVVRADRRGVSYLCSDCGAWPGGRVDLTWKQWHALNPGVYATVTKAGSAWDRALAGLPTSSAQGRGATLQVAAVGPLASLGARREMLAAGHVSLLSPKRIYSCGLKPNSQHCPPYILCCWDCYLRSLQEGPSEGDPVNLATGEEEYTPAPDLMVYNPHGPSVVWQRVYNSLRGGSHNTSQPYDDLDFGIGWSDNYNIFVVDPDGTTGSTKYFVSPNGGRVPFTSPAVPTAANPVVHCSVQAGAAMLIDWTYDPNNTTAGLSTYGSFTITYPNRSRWITHNLYGTQSSGFGQSLTQITDRNGNSIYFNYAQEYVSTSVSPYGYTYQLASITTAPGGEGTALLTLSHHGSDGLLVDHVTDSYGRSVYYGTNGPFVLETVTSVSQVVPTGTTNWPVRWSYGYLIPDDYRYSYSYFLQTITVPSPSTTGPPTSVATITYDPNTYMVTQVKDGNGNTRNYAYNAAGPNQTTVTVKDSNQNTVYAYTKGYDMHLSQTTETDGAGRVVSSPVYSDPNDPYQPSAVTDGNGNTWSYTHDPYGNLLTESPPASSRRTPAATINSYSYANFALGELTQTQEGTKTPTAYTYYEPSGLVATVTGPPPGTTGAAAILLSASTYDGLGNATSMTMPGPNSTGAVPGTPGYAANYATYVTTTMNYTTDGGYGQADALGEPLSVTDPLGHTTHYRYAESVPYAPVPGQPLNRGHATAVTDALGNEMDAAFNIDDRPLSTVYPATGQSGAGRGRTVNTYLYDEPGDTGGFEQYGPLASVQTFDEGNTSGPFRTVSYAYGLEGETLGVSGSTEPVTYTYDALYRLSALADGGGNTTRYFYDAAGYLSQVAYPLAGATTAPLAAGSPDTVTYTGYDADGDVLARVDGNGTTTSYTYADPESLLTDIHYVPGAGVSALADTASAYDAYGRRQTLTDATGGHAYAYSDDDSLTSDATTYTGLPTLTLAYAYDPDGSRASMTTPAGSFSYAYDSAGRETGLTNPFGEATAWSYLDNDWPASRRLSTGGLATFAYDARGQVTDLLNRNPDGSVGSEFGGAGANAAAALTYDGDGNRTSLHAQDNDNLSGADTGVTHYAYDGRDQLVGEAGTRGGGYSNAFAYDGVTSGTSAGPGDATTMRGRAQSFDADDRLSGSGFAYDGDGNPVGYGGSTLSFDPEGRLSGLTPATASAPAVPDAGFEAPSVGSGPSGYQYQPAGGPWSFPPSASGGSGLTGNGSAFGSPPAPEGGQAAFLQDQGALSQALSGFVAGTQYTLTVSAAERDYLGVNTQSVAVQLDGQTVGVVTPSGTSYQDYTVGPFTAGPGGHTLSFVGLVSTGDNTAFLDDVRLAASASSSSSGYTGDGLRAWKSSGGGTTYFLYDGEQPVCELDASGAVSFVNTFGADGLVSRRAVGNRFNHNPSTFYAFDPTGNVVARAAGNTLNGGAGAYDAFGGLVPGSSSPPDPFGFGGQWGGYTDAETGLVLCTHRYYDPGTGRFLTRDPMGYDGGIDLYAYCRNDPVNECDPSGNHGVGVYQCRNLWFRNPPCLIPGFGHCVTQCVLIRVIAGRPAPLITTTLTLPSRLCRSTPPGKVPPNSIHFN